MPIKNFLLTLNALFLCLFYSCSTPQPKGKTEAERLYNDALNLVEDSRFLLATEALNTLRSKYPYSYFASHAELLQADILFKQENYIEAATAYSLFRDLHPKHERIAYVIWKIGESFYYQIPETFDRDLTPAKEAQRFYKELLTRYPNNEHKQEALDRIDECNQMFLNKKKYIADFYFKTEVYDAARFWYLDLLKSFKKSDMVNYSRQRIVRSSFLLNEKEKCIYYSKKFLKSSSKDNQSFFSDYVERCQKIVPKTESKG